MTNQYGSLSRLIPDLNHTILSPPEVHIRDSFQCGPTPVLTKQPSAHLESIWAGDSSADWQHSPRPSVVMASLTRDVTPGVQVEIYVGGAFGLGWRPLTLTPTAIARSASSTEPRTEHLQIYYRVAWHGQIKPGRYALEITFEGVTQ